MRKTTSRRPWQARSVLDKIGKVPESDPARDFLRRQEDKLKRAADDANSAFADDELLGPRVNGDVDKLVIDTDTIHIHTVNTKVDGFVDILDNLEAEIKRVRNIHSLTI